MFVTVSPASFNREETRMSLYYASRVKQITNEPVKNVESRELARLRQELDEVLAERDTLKEALER